VRAIIIIFFCLIMHSSLAQHKELFVDGNALFDDDNNYLYQLQLTCDSADVFKGKVIYTPKNYMTIQQRMRSVFQQAIQINIIPTTKKIILQEGNAIGSSNRYGNVVCYMKGELDYIIQDEATFCFGRIIGFDIAGDSCGAAYVYLTCNNNIETFCTNKNIQNNKSIDKKSYQIAIQQLFAKEKAAKIADSATIQITTLPALLAPNSIFTLLHQGDSLQLSVSDYDAEDDDLISISVNNKIVLSNYILKKEPIVFTIPASDNGDTIVIASHNVGLYSPNSALINIGDGATFYTFKTASEANDKMILYCNKKAKKNSP
jgi:hypothetical protein